MEFMDNVKLYHWSTTNYTRHVVAGNLYQDMSDAVDSFVEICIGLHGMSLPKGKLSVAVIKDSGFIKYVDEFSKFVSGIKEPELSNQRDEILDLLHKYLYLLRME